MAECERRVFADRAEWLGDPDFVRVPVAPLLDTAYLRSRMGSYSPLMATPGSAVQAGEFPAFNEHDQTTHFSIVDGDGNAVAQTTTLNDSYGNKVVVRGAGFLLNNEMDDFSIKPGVPNMYGLVGSRANAIAPGKRMLSSMTPTIVEHNGSLRLVVGTPGGSTIITSVFQTIVNVLDYGMSMQQAVNMSRFHHQWLPDKITVEHSGLGSAVMEELKRRGHILGTKDAIGRVDAIERDAAGRLHTGADPRGDDAACGY
jgi:gamma-glutamyltranspeptidase/glutathione hydrolase